MRTIIKFFKYFIQETDQFIKEDKCCHEYQDYDKKPRYFVAHVECGKRKKVTEGEERRRPDQGGSYFRLQELFIIYPLETRKNNHEMVRAHYEFRNKDRPKGFLFECRQEVVDLFLDIFEKPVVIVSSRQVSAESIAHKSL